MRTSHYLRASALLMCVAVAHGQERSYEDWGIGIADDQTYLYAATKNDSGEILGEYCYFKSKKCVWLVSFNTKCKAGDSYPILANSDSSAIALTVTCFGPIDEHSSVHVYGFDDWKLLESMLKDAGRVGFATALSGDQFSVARFSLSGRTDATAALEAMFSEKIKSLGATQERATTDLRL